jgi:hypothetical protein
MTEHDEERDRSGNEPVTEDEVAEVESGDREPGDRAEEIQRAAEREETAAEG